MFDLWEHMAFADVSVSLLPPVTELNGWERTVKVAVTCHCREVSTTSAFPAVPEPLVHGTIGRRISSTFFLLFFFLWLQPMHGKHFKFCWEEPFVSLWQQVDIFFTLFSTKVTRNSEKGHFFLSFIFPSPSLLSFPSRCAEPLMLSTSCPWECPHSCPNEDFLSIQQINCSSNHWQRLMFRCCSLVFSPRTIRGGCDINCWLKALWFMAFLGAGGKTSCW